MPRQGSYRGRAGGKKYRCGASLMVQWLRLHPSIAGDTGLIPGLGTKIPHAAWCSQRKRKERNVGDGGLPASLMLASW